MGGKEGKVVCLVLEILPWTMWREVQMSHRQLDLESGGRGRLESKTYSGVIMHIGGS